jgi:hypothetical protein
VCSPPEEGEQPDPVLCDVHPPRGLGDRPRRSQRTGSRGSWFTDPEWGRLDSRSAGRNPNAMMLRSAEADPHVTEHVSRTPAEAGERARAKSRAPCGDAEASSRDTQSNRPAKEATPVRPSRECFARGPKASVRWCRNRSHDSLGNLPRRRRSDAGDWARSNLAVQPTSRRCSADESVVPHRRCQRRDTRSFHGLCSSPRSIKLRSVPAMPNWRGHSTEPKLERVAPSLSPAQQAASASG